MFFFLIYCISLFVMMTSSYAEEAKMGSPVVLTVVYDNNDGPACLLSKWGFGTFIEGLEKNILFDTGGSPEVLTNNLSKLNIDQKKIDYIVISHMHWDHAGGLSAVLQKGQTVFLPSGASARTIKEIEAAGAKAVIADQKMEITPHVTTTGTFKGGIPEQGLVLKAGKERILITGCAHPGIEKMVTSLCSEDLCPETVLGGFHLKNKTKDEITRIAMALKQVGVKKAGPCHCSGDMARKVFAELFMENFLAVNLGSILTFK